MALLLDTKYERNYSSPLNCSFFGVSFSQHARDVRTQPKILDHARKGTETDVQECGAFPIYEQPKYQYNKIIVDPTLTCFGCSYIEKDMPSKSAMFLLHFLS